MDHLTRASRQAMKQLERAEKELNGSATPELLAARTGLDLEKIAQVRAEAAVKPVPLDESLSVLWPVSRGERVEIAPLRGAALREAIIRPAADAGVHLEPVLLERLLHDAGGEPGALSLVQETMVLLWERRTRRLLTVSAYEELGGQGRSGLAAALATRADAALAALSPRSE